MRLFGYDVSVTKAPVGVTQIPVSALTTGWWPSFMGRIRESFPGAWQRNIEVETPANILKFSAVYACVSLIADDISKLRIKLVQDDGTGIWREVSNPAYSPVLRKPNRYQTRIDFVKHWIISKLLNGNSYVLKERDARNVVVALHVLDPRRVTPLVTEEGAVYYRLKSDQLAEVRDEDVVVPADDILHDRMLTLWHPLVGVSPIYACGSSATQGIRIQANSGKFFEHMSRPSGILSVPGEISEDSAKQFKADWEANYSAGNVGKVAVLSGGVKYETITIPAAEAQLIEQLKWTVEDVARCFHVPLHKLGLVQPTYNNIAALNQDYYTQTLQSLIESLELLLDEGLRMPANLGTELDLEGLLRMDPLSLADYNERSVRAGIMSPNEARWRLNLPPVEGGNTPYMQQQNYSLEALNQRPPPDSEPKALPAPEVNDDADDNVKALADALIKRFTVEHV